MRGRRTPRIADGGDKNIQRVYKEACIIVRCVFHEFFLLLFEREDERFIEDDTHLQPALLLAEKDEMVSLARSVAGS